MPAVAKANTDVSKLTQELERCRARISQLERQAGDASRERSAPLDGYSQNPLFELSRDALWVVDDAGIILRVNQAACNLFGSTEDQLQGAHISSIPTPAKMITAARFFERYLAAGADESGDFSFLRGEQVCHTEYSARRVAAGVHIIAFRDITDRRRTAEALRANEELFEQLVTRMDNIFWMIAASSGTVLYISPAYERIWGQSCENLISNPDSWWALVHPDDVDLLEATLTRVAHDYTLQGEKVDFRVNRPDGGMRWITVWAYPMVDAQGVITRICGLTTDITERKIAAEQLQQANDRLEARVEERTAELLRANALLQREMNERMLAQEELRRRQDELAHVQRQSTVIEMAGGLAHELNQPLAAAMNYAGSCLSELNEAAPNLKEVRTGIEQVINQAERAASIIRRMREFVQKRDPRSDAVDLNQAIREAASLLAFETRRAKARVNLQLDDGIPTVAGDRILIEQVLVNLIRNALDAVEGVAEAERELTITTRRGPIGGVEAAVCDSGRGFSKSTLDNLFQPFFTSKPGGLGMGLAISRSIVESHKGRLTVDRDRKRGAVVRMTLPASTDIGNGDV